MRGGKKEVGLTTRKRDEREGGREGGHGGGRERGGESMERSGRRI